MSKGNKKRAAAPINARLYLEKRLGGIRAALDRLQSTHRTDCSNWLRGQIAYFKREEADLVQAIQEIDNAVQNGQPD